MRTSVKKINSSLKNQIVKTFSQTISDLKNFEEAQEFLENFLTDAELEALAKRLAVAYWLKKGRSYSNIKLNLKVSSATIANIQAAMEDPGFKLALKKIEAEEWANVWSNRIKKFVRK